MSCSDIHGKCFGQEVKEAQSQQEGAAKGQQQGHVLLKPVAQPFSEKSA